MCQTGLQCAITAVCGAGGTRQGGAFSGREKMGLLTIQGVR
jgi:hypothetical protein